jgi:hypothetical protein
MANQMRNEKKKTDINHLKYSIHTIGAFKNGIYGITSEIYAAIKNR